MKKKISVSLISMAVLLVISVMMCGCGGSATDGSIDHKALIVGRWSNEKANVVAVFGKDGTVVTYQDGEKVLEDTYTIEEKGANSIIIKTTKGSTMNNVVFKDNNTIESDGDTLIRVTQEENNSESKPSKAYIDAPASGETISTNNYKVSGWFLDSAGVAKVEILIDGNKVGVAAYGNSRPDVQKVHSDYVNAANSGFQYSLDTSGLSNGAHTLTAVETNADGKTSNKKVNFIIAKSPKALVLGRWTSGGDALQFNENGKVDIYADGSQDQATYKLSAINGSNNSIMITITDSGGSSSSETAVFTDENTMLIGDITFNRHK